MPPVTRSEAKGGGFALQLLDATGSPVGQPFTTDSTGRGLSPAVPVGETYTTERSRRAPGSNLGRIKAFVASTNDAHKSTSGNSVIAGSNPGYGR